MLQIASIVEIVVDIEHREGHRAVKELNKCRQTSRPGCGATSLFNRCLERETQKWHD